LDLAVTKGETKTLLMVAAPRALGMIRAMYSPALRKAIRAEFGKAKLALPKRSLRECGAAVDSAPIMSSRSTSLREATPNLVLP
jgi:protein required for attachment to host cells